MKQPTIFNLFLVALLLLLVVLGSIFITKPITTTSDAVYPSFVMADKMTFSAYDYVNTNQDYISKFDCFCGCYDHAGHTNLRDCYYDNAGNIQEHASFCDVCKAIVQKVEKGTNEGKSIDEIKEKIMKDYL